MKSYKTAVLAVISAAVLPVLTVGCDRTVSHTEKTKVDGNGEVKQKETTVKQNPDGTVTKTEENKKTEPVNP